MISPVEVSVHLSNLLNFLSKRKRFNLLDRYGWTNKLNISVPKLLLENNYCTVIYYDQNLDSVQNECNRQCQFRAAAGQELLLHGVPTVWIAAGTDHMEAQLKNAIEIGCQVSLQSWSLEFLIKYSFFRSLTWPSPIIRRAFWKWSFTSTIELRNEFAIQTFSCFMKMWPWWTIITFSEKQWNVTIKYLF